jgi:hypothetical protein
MMREVATPRWRGKDMKYPSCIEKVTGKDVNATDVQKRSRLGSQDRQAM